MSSIGSAGSGAYNLISSIAGSQRNHGENERTKAEADGRRFSLNNAELTENLVSNVAGTDGSPDRDPNGRLPFDAQPDDLEGETHTSADYEAPADIEGVRGGSLDLQV